MAADYTLVVVGMTSPKAIAERMGFAFADVQVKDGVWTADAHERLGLSMSLRRGMHGEFRAGDWTLRPRRYTHADLRADKELPVKAWRSAVMLAERVLETGDEDVALIAFDRHPVLERLDGVFRRLPGEFTRRDPESILLDELGLVAEAAASNIVGRHSDVETRSAALLLRQAACDRQHPLWTAFERLAHRLADRIDRHRPRHVPDLGEIVAQLGDRIEAEAVRDLESLAEDLYERKVSLTREELWGIEAAARKRRADRTRFARLRELVEDRPTPERTVGALFTDYRYEDVTLDERLLADADVDALGWVQFLSPDDVRAAVALLIEVADDPTHPVVPEPGRNPCFSFSDDPETWAWFGRFARRLADRAAYLLADEPAPDRVAADVFAEHFNADEVWGATLDQLLFAADAAARDLAQTRPPATARAVADRLRALAEDRRDPLVLKLEVASRFHWITHWEDHWPELQAVARRIADRVDALVP
jgi:hypothetical protein